MAIAVKRVCRCGGVVTGNVCSRCGPRREQRVSRNDLYGYRWQKFRARYVSDHPLCADCEREGRVRLTSDVHHVIKATQHPELLYEESNLMPLCHACHASRTIKGE